MKKKLLIVIGVFLISGWGYVQLINRNSPSMTTKQKIIRALYPLITFFAGSGERNKGEASNSAIQPTVSFYSLKAILNNGNLFDFQSLKGKKILLVNTASNCGFTPQYTELQQLQERYPEQLVIIGFPANDFKQQEQGSNEEIATFCRKNFGVTFPLVQKSVVIKTPEQNNVYKWLTDSTSNGWNNKAPSWNFSKYLVNERGMLVNYFGPATSPLSEEVLAAIKK